MDRQRRLQYLQALGIDAWVPTRGAAEEQPARGDTVAWPTSGSLERNAQAIPEALDTGTPVDADSSAPQSSLPVEDDFFGVSPAGPAPVRSSASSQAPGASSTARVGGAAARSIPDYGDQLTVPDADKPAAWEALKAEVLACTKCILHTTRIQGVFGVGDRKADWLVIGEAPGAEEDKRGEPFVGRGGQLLDSMLRAIHLAREAAPNLDTVYIANILKSRPPGNRDPKPDEVAACLPYLFQQIRLLQPKIILAVGRIAAQTLLATDAPLGRLRGKVHQFGPLNTPLVVTYHPAYLLRSPGEKRKAWDDLKFARGVFRQLSAPQGH